MISRTRTYRGKALALGLLLTGVPSGELIASDRIVGADSPNGGAYLIRHFRVPQGTVINGIEFVNNDPRTVFPKVALLRGPAKRISEARVLVELTDVRPITDHRVRVTLSPISVDSPQDLYIAVGLPAGNGIQAVGDGSGIAATQLNAPGDSYFASGEDGDFGAMDVEYEIQLLASLGKPTLPAAEPEATLPLVAGVKVLPNPFNPSVSIELHVPQVAQVDVRVYDIAGRLVRSLVQEKFAPGVHRREWTGRDDRGRRVAAGIYVVRLNIGDDVFTKKLVLAK